MLMIMAFSIVSNAAYRNVALNKSDIHDSKWKPASGYPHASSNNEYNAPSPGVAEPRYYAIGAINGDTANEHHGVEGYFSWGPQMNFPNLYWRVDFGKLMLVDKVVIWVRADWPTHDSYWKSATLVFSDSTKVDIKIDSLCTPQTFSFTPRKTSTVTITNLVQSNKSMWCGFTEVQVWGDDPVSVKLPATGMNMNSRDAKNIQVVFPTQRLTAEPAVHSFDFFAPNGRLLGAWHRAQEVGAVDVGLPAAVGTSLIVARVSHEY
jgi:hypothetical protein